MEVQAKSKLSSDSELLRVAIAGSIDDGKSTLLGRIMLDTNSLPEDIVSSVSGISQKKGVHTLDLSLFTDGLKKERDKGITIDVAYRYFSTPKRKFIVADTPGHVEFTRNMVTGSSLANAAIILIDAHIGISEQTFRHSYLTSLLQIPHLVVCVNKMDLVDFSEDVFENLANEFNAFAAKLDVQDIIFIPTSGLLGDNVVKRSANLAWYDGPTLVYLLEHMHIASDYNHIDARLPIQNVVRVDGKKEILLGQIAGGVFNVGDNVILLPCEDLSQIEEITYAGKKVDRAFVQCRWPLR